MVVLILYMRKMIDRTLFLLFFLPALVFAQLNQQMKLDTLYMVEGEVFTEDFGEEYAVLHIGSQIQNLKMETNRKIIRRIERSSGDWDYAIPIGSHHLKFIAD